MSDELQWSTLALAVAKICSAPALQDMSMAVDAPFHPMMGGPGMMGGPMAMGPMGPIGMLPSGPLMPRPPVPPPGPPPLGVPPPRPPSEPAPGLGLRPSAAPKAAVTGPTPEPADYARLIGAVSYLDRTKGLCVMLGLSAFKEADVGPAAMAAAAASLASREALRGSAYADSMEGLIRI